MRKPGLGKGLAALIPEASPDQRDVVRLRVADIRPNPYQPRQDFDEAGLDELARSLQEHGLVQPVLVRPAGEGYELVIGERRWRAARRAGLDRIPALVRPFTNGEMIELALVENLQREDLNPIEEATAYQRLIAEFGLTHETIAQKVGKSRVHVTNTLRLLNLEPEIQVRVRQGALSAGHARALAGIEPRGVRLKLARRIEAEGLTVRQVEELARQLRPAPAAGPARGRPAARSADPALEAVSARLRQALGTLVRVRSARKKYVLEVECYGLDELNRVVDLLAPEPGGGLLQAGAGASGQAGEAAGSQQEIPAFPAKPS